MRAGQCQGLEINIFLFLPSDSQLSVLLRKNLKIWVRGEWEWEAGGLISKRRLRLA